MVVIRSEDLKVKNTKKNMQPLHNIKVFSQPCNKKRLLFHKVEFKFFRMRKIVIKIDPIKEYV